MPDNDTLTDTTILPVSTTPDGMAIVPVDDAKEVAAAKDISAGGKGIPFKGEFDIYPARPAHELAPPPLQAYAAKSRRNQSAYAVLCQKHLVPRLELIHKYTMLQHEGLPRLLASGILDWTPEGKQHYTLVYEHTQGKPLVENELNVALGWKEEFVRHVVLKSLVPILQDLRYSELPHGNLRLSNIFTVGTKTPVPGNIDRLMLGECLSLPWGHSQPAIYLPIERILCQPAGRGDGGYEDDMYALGVCLGLMLRTADPNANATDREIFERKVEHGSFITIIGKSRIAGIILELIRGLLQDDPIQRWTLEDVQGWMEGRRIPPKNAGVMGKNKASRPLKFAGKEHIRPTLLSVAMTDHISEAVQMIESGELDSWISRSLEDKTLGKRVQMAISSAADQMIAAGFQERLVTLVAIALAPNLPVSYKGLTFMPDGFGRLLVQAYATGLNLTIFADVLRYRLIYGWFEHGDLSKFDIGVMQQRLMVCNNSIRQTASGHGLERCAYTLSPDSPCLSEKFADYYIRSPDDLLGAIEGLLASKKAVDNPFDRHVTAFMLARDHTSIDHSLPDLSSTENFRRFTAIIRSLNKLQTRLKDSKFPQITTWLASHAQPLIERFHDRDQRQRVKDALEKAKGSGDIKLLMSIVDDPSQKQIDQHDFRNAMTKFQYLKREHAKLEHSLNTDPRFGYGTGREMAAMASGIICFLVIAILILLKFTHSGGM